MENSVLERINKVIYNNGYIFALVDTLKCTIPTRTAKDWIIVKGKLSWFLWKRLNNKVNELVNCAIKNRENPPSPSLDA